MVDCFGLLLRTGYYYSHIIGVNNFELDWRTGRVFKSSRSTLYAMAKSIIIVILISFILIGGETFTVFFGVINNLYGYVVCIVSIMRITAGLANLLSQRRHQFEMMILARDALQLCLARPQVIRMSRWRILFKSLNCLLTDIFPFVTAWVSIGLTNVFPGIALQLWMSAILNLAMAQYFLVMLCIRGHYNLLNTELKEVIKESKSLSYNPSRKGSFMTRCCTLADQLEAIAKLQSKLQSILLQLNEVFGIQTLMMYICYYVASVVTSYTSYKIFKGHHKGPRIALRTLSLTWCFLFHVDAFHNLFTVFHVQDAHKEMIRLLGERTLFASSLDARLEESFESLQLQLIRNPLKLDVLQLFPINRDSSWAMVASMLLHSIYLVQYELENFRRK